MLQWVLFRLHFASPFDSGRLFGHKTKVTYVNMGLTTSAYSRYIMFDTSTYDFSPGQHRGYRSVLFLSCIDVD